ncbi:MAG: hypothetical protein QNI97_13935 [Desulfobacterales bacterium]|nr:hypothetical protein [Desulfobacterales bacterium]
MPNLLDRAMAHAIDALHCWPARTVRLCHHNDADGLSSGAILSRSLARAGFGVDRICLEKPYPQILAELFQSRGEVLIFADFAGQIAPLISSYNQGRNLVLILDHHPARPATDPCVHNLDPDLFGYRGDRDVSASTACYRFAHILARSNDDLAYLAVTGAVGDGFFRDGRLAGLNREAARTAQAMGQLEIRPHAGGERYCFLEDCVHEGPVERLAADLDILGGMGFFQGGPEAGLQICLEGYDEETRRLTTALTRQRQKIFQAEIDHLRAGGMASTGRIQWFHVARRFDGIGVKMIGAFCRFIRQSEFIDPDNYIAGFQPVPDVLPGLGAIRFNAVKVSMRVGPALETRIRNGQMPGLDRLLPEATRTVGGFVDACHSLAAATTVPPGQERHLVDALDRIVRNHTRSAG